METGNPPRLLADSQVTKVTEQRCSERFGKEMDDIRYLVVFFSLRKEGRCFYSCVGLVLEIWLLTNFIIPFLL